MSDIKLECKGLPCPQPVLKCKELIEKQRPTSMSVVVDNEASKVNVTRYLETQGYVTKTDKKNNDFIVSATISADTQCPPIQPMDQQDVQNITHKDLVLVASDVIGDGDDQLGAKLMVNFVATLKEMGSDLWRIIMVNGGVKLAVDGHPCLNDLQQLEKNGVSILVCGTCLEHFNLTGKKRAGEVTNMLDVVTSLQLATKTIRV